MKRDFEVVFSNNSEKGNVSGLFAGYTDEGHMICGITCTDEFVDGMLEQTADGLAKSTGKSFLSRKARTGAAFESMMDLAIFSLIDEYLSKTDQDFKTFVKAYLQTKKKRRELHENGMEYHGRVNSKSNDIQDEIQAFLDDCEKAIKRCKRDVEGD